MSFTQHQDYKSMREFQEFKSAAVYSFLKILKTASLLKADHYSVAQPSYSNMCT